MRQDDKKLLLIDLSARAPYGVHCAVYKMNGDILEEDDIIYYVTPLNVVALKHNSSNECFMVYQIKPYLRPMSSMTEEERDDFYHNRTFHDGRMWESEGFDVDWLNAHHFDYRGLIEKGLALEAPEGMYKN